MHNVKSMPDAETQPPASTNRDLLMKTYQAFNNREIEKVLAIMHPEVVWPNGWEGGYVHGCDGVRDYWTRQWAAIDPQVEPVGFDTDEMGRTVVTVRQLVRDLAGRVIADGTVAHTYVIEGGLIKGMEIGR
jgi:hypothetical protein